MIRILGFGGLVFVAITSTNLAAEERATLPLLHGIYVEAGTSCTNVTNSTSVSFWGDALNSSHIEGHIADVALQDGVYTVTLDLESTSGMGGGVSERVLWGITTSNPGELSIDNGFNVASYRWCAASMLDLTGDGKKNVAVPSELLELAPEGSPPFMGVWGFVNDEGGIFCEPHDIKVFALEYAESEHSLMKYDSSYNEVAPGHWRLEGVGVYEDDEFPLILDLYLEGNKMREVIATADGHHHITELARCE
ncbi:MULTISPECIES: hypothetical protein [unclassified Halomonas]|uniref:hypothetical protein n=1 Tax=unclassified Halomonas TaxID=2609666 RepID=UPI000990602F|nr:MULTISPECIES: hypothetical protein [unclassified Halomonas]AQU82923.1 hypothetical protein B2G49_10090 [Halomonas sp. 'Soap Lake \